MMRRAGATLPNFIVVGAMKAGTTALHRYLSQHPQVFMPRRKELRYFTLPGPPDYKGPGDEAVNKNWVRTWEDYKAQFSEGSDYRARGEASPFYLVSPHSPALIAERLPDVKVVISLRDPVNRAFSSFNYLRNLGREALSDFGAALAAESKRKAEGWEPLWLYKEASTYASQIERYLEHFPRDRIWIGLQEDLEANRNSLLRDLFGFLDVEPDFVPTDVGRPNKSGVARSPMLDRIMHGENVLRTIAKHALPQPIRKRLRRGLNEANLQRVELPSAVAASLRRELQPEIDRLESLLERDLSSWK